MKTNQISNSIFNLKDLSTWPFPNENNKRNYNKIKMARELTYFYEHIFVNKDKNSYLK